MPILQVLVGPPGSGKSTVAKSEFKDFVYVNQDSQGREGQLRIFHEAIRAGKDVVVDRMGFNKEQRGRYIKPAREAGYEVKIIVLHVPRDVCFDRCMKREGHETIKDEVNATQALNTFFTKYDKPTDDEGSIDWRYPVADLELGRVVMVDLDGTLCNIEHRLHFVKDGRKDWKSFFSEMDKDGINGWCREIIDGLLLQSSQVIFCSGRPDNYREKTETWLRCHSYHAVDKVHCPDQMYLHLFMRPAGDQRKDDIIKEVILDFEILGRGYEPFFAIDDRTQICELWRRRGIVCLQCAEGNF